MLFPNPLFQGEAKTTLNQAAPAWAQRHHKLHVVSCQILTCPEKTRAIKGYARQPWHVPVLL